MKAEAERVIIQAHWNEALAREKRLKPVDHYLKQQAKPAIDNHQFVARLEQMEARGMAVRVKRIERKEE